MFHKIFSNCAILPKTAVFLLLIHAQRLVAQPFAQPQPFLVVAGEVQRGEGAGEALHLEGVQPAPVGDAALQLLAEGFARGAQALV